MKAKEKNVDWWLFGHEMGHMFTPTEFWFLGEPSANLFAMYTLNKVVWEGGNNDATFPDSRYIKFGLNKPADPAVLEGYNWNMGQYEEAPKENLIRQLVEQYGWDSMRAVFASYHDPKYPKETYGEGADGFAHRLSAVTKADLSDYFLHWGYPISEGTVGKIREMGHPSWLPEGES